MDLGPRRSALVFETSRFLATIQPVGPGEVFALLCFREVKASPAEAPLTAGEASA